MKRRPTTITAAEYRRLVETARRTNERRAGTQHQGHPEHDLQVACVAWFRAAFPEDAAMLFAVPNGGRRGKVEAAIMKAEGVTAGVSDLILLEARGGYGALCIEMKTRSKSSRQSKSQREWQAAAERAGNKYVVCRDMAEFYREISAYMRMPKTGTVQVSGEELYLAQIGARTAKEAKF